MSDNQYERTRYFIERFLQMLRSNGDIDFNSFPNCGLLELSRQYVSMPPAVRELSSEYIKSSILHIIEHSSLLFKSANQVPIKEVKPLYASDPNRENDTCGDEDTYRRKKNVFKCCINPSKAGCPEIVTFEVCCQKEFGDICIPLLCNPLIIPVHPPK